MDRRTSFPVLQTRCAMEQPPGLPEMGGCGASADMMGSINAREEEQPIRENAFHSAVISPKQTGQLVTEVHISVLVPLRVCDEEPSVLPIEILRPRRNDLAYAHPEDIAHTEGDGKFHCSVGVPARLVPLPIVDGCEDIPDFVPFGKIRQWPVFLPENGRGADRQSETLHVLREHSRRIETIFSRVMGLRCVKLGPCPHHLVVDNPCVVFCSCKKFVEPPKEEQFIVIGITQRTFFCNQTVGKR